MVTRTTMAIESGWHKAPRIEVIEHEFGSYELKVTKSGLHSFSAADGEHDDVVSAALLAISGAFQNTMAESADRVLEQTIGDTLDGELDVIAAYSDVAGGDETFFNNVDAEDDMDIDLDEL